MLRGCRALVSAPGGVHPLPGGCGDIGVLKLAAPLQPVPAQEEIGQGKAGKPKLHHKRSPARWGSVPQFSHIPYGDNVIATQAVGKKHSETDFHKDSLPRSWSCGTPGLLIIHLVLGQVFKIAPVTHCAEKGQRVSDAASGAAGCFPCDGMWGEMPPPSLQLFGSLRQAWPPLAHRSGFSPQRSSAFFQLWQTFGCCSPPIPRRGCGKYKRPFCCGSRLPWPVLPATPSTLAGDGCVQDECWPFSSPWSSMGLQCSQNRRSNSLKSHSGPTSSFFFPLLNCRYFPC